MVLGISLSCKQTTQHASSPSSSPHGERGTFLDSARHVTPRGRTVARLTLRRRHYASSSWFVVPDSVLPDVLAMHTIEMIPKSMILSVECSWSDSQYQYLAQILVCGTALGNTVLNYCSER